MQDVVSIDEGPVALMSLVRAIHGAAIDATAWPAVLERLRLRLGARVLTLGHHEFSTGFGSALFESPGSVGFAQDEAPFSARNPWFMSSADYVAGRVMTGDELISVPELRRTDFYRGVLQPRGLLHRLCGVVAQRPGSVDVLVALRAEDEPAFDAVERADLALVLGHVTLALQSQWRWQEADDLSRAFTAIADRDPTAMLLVTDDGAPVYRNRAAEALLEAAAGLRLERGRVVAAHVGDQRLLEQRIALAAGDAAPGLVEASVVSLAGGLVVQVRPAGRLFLRQRGERRGVALVAVRGGRVAHDPAACVFASLYELTPAQARVSALVFAGRPLPAIARALCVSENTVRSHLKQVFQKTGVHGQMELVHLHARVCPVTG